MNLRFISSTVKAVAVSMCLTLILMLVFSLISITKKNPTEFLQSFAYICLYTSSVVCGYCAAKMHKSKHIPIAALSGSLFSLLILIISLFSENEMRASGAMRWFQYLLIILISIVGGVLASPKQRSIKRTKSKLMKSRR